MNIKRRLFFCFMAVLLSEAQTEIPVKSVNHRILTVRRGPFRRRNCVEHPPRVGRKRSHSYHAHPPRSVPDKRLNNLNTRLLSVSGSDAESEGSQSGRSACSVLCTSSGRSFGLLFA